MRAFTRDGRTQMNIKLNIKRYLGIYVIVDQTFMYVCVVILREVFIFQLF